MSAENLARPLPPPPPGCQLILRLRIRIRKSEEVGKKQRLMKDKLAKEQKESKREEK